MSAKLDWEQPVAWMAFCPYSGGRLFDHTEERARSRAQTIYSPYGFVVLPLFVNSAEITTDRP